MDWCNEYKKLEIRANAETEIDTSKALEFGAEGIGLCRTEHMFFEGERILPMREMIMSDSKQGRKRALKKLINYQISDFESLFKLLKGKPITVRLLDPPMHEFLPKSDLEISQLRTAIIVNKNIKATNYQIDTYKKKIYIYGIALTSEEKDLVISEAKEILDVEDVIASIILVEDLRVQRE